MNEHGIDFDKIVASFADAWIETEQLPGVLYPDMSHPLRMRGLKLLFDLLSFDM